MTPSWYDVLDLDPSATPEEIREAWRASIADLDPGDRRFRLRNQAAEVLLDEQRRADYDATLAEEQEQAEVAEAGEAEKPGSDEAQAGTAPPATGLAEAPEEESVFVVSDEDAEPDPTPAQGSTGRGPGVVTLVLLGVVVAVLLTVTVVSLVVTGTASDTEQAAEQAQAAAEQAIAPVLSYDYRDMDKSAAAARSYLTPDFTKQYEKLFATLENNAPETKTVVNAEVLASSVVRATPEQVDVFLFVNQVTQKAESEEQVYRNQVTVTMKRVDDTWLIDSLNTQDPPS